MEKKIKLEIQNKIIALNDELSIDVVPMLKCLHEIREKYTNTINARGEAYSKMIDIFDDDVLNGLKAIYTNHDELCEKVKEMQKENHIQQEIYNKYSKDITIYIKIINYYKRVLENRLKNLGYDLVKIIHDYNIKSTRDFNELKTIIELYSIDRSKVKSYEEYTQYLNKHLCFYACISKYNRQLHLYLKSDINNPYNNSVVDTYVGLYTLYDAWENLQDSFYENDYIIKYENIEFEKDIDKIINNINELFELDAKQKKEMNDLLESQRKEWSEKNIYGITID